MAWRWHISRGELSSQELANGQLFLNCAFVVNTPLPAPASCPWACQHDDETASLAGRQHRRISCVLVLEARVHEVWLKATANIGFCFERRCGLTHMVRTNAGKLFDLRLPRRVVLSFGSIFSQRRAFSGVRVLAAWCVPHLLQEDFVLERCRPAFRARQRFSRSVFTSNRW